MPDDLDKAWAEFESETFTAHGISLNDEPRTLLRMIYALGFRQGAKCYRALDSLGAAAADQLRRRLRTQIDNALADGRNSVTTMKGYR